MKRLFAPLTRHSDSMLQHRLLRPWASRLRHPSLWRLNRHSVARAMAIGLFWALIPMPWQMVPAAFSAARWRGNLPIAMAVCWLSNPLTWAPLWYGTYRFGLLLLGHQSQSPPSADWAQALADIGSIWWPLYFGSTVAGVVLAVLGYFAVHAFWRVNVTYRLSRRRARLA